MEQETDAVTLPRPEEPEDGYDSIIGLHEAKQLLLESVILPQILPREIRAKILSGVRGRSSHALLYGPPGVGKTLLARASAKEAQAVLYSVSPGTLLSAFLGVAEKTLKALFCFAAKHERAIIFFDEIDSLTTRRSERSDISGASNRQLLCELLVQMNTHNLASNLVIIAATNRPEDMDEALLRRFATKIFVGLPSAEDRYEMLKGLLRSIDHNLSIRDCTDVIELTEDWNPCELESFTREACMGPLRDPSVMQQLLALRGKTDISGYASSRCGAGASSSSSSMNANDEVPRSAAVPTIRPVSLEDFQKAHDRIFHEHARN